MLMVSKYILYSYCILVLEKKINYLICNNEVNIHMCMCVHKKSYFKASLILFKLSHSLNAVKMVKYYVSACPCYKIVGVIHMH